MIIKDVNFKYLNSKLMFIYNWLSLYYNGVCWMMGGEVKWWEVVMVGGWYNVL